MKTVALTALVLLTASTARADMLVWKLKADCPAGSNLLTLSMTYSSPAIQYGMDSGPTPDRVSRVKELFGCGGSCSTAPLAIPAWVEPKIACVCYPPRADGSTDSPCDQNQYQKCTTTVRTQVAYRCDDLAHEKLCVSDTCKDSWSSYGDDNPCAELKPSATATRCLASPPDITSAVVTGFTKAHEQQLPQPQPGDVLPADEAGGCSMASRGATDPSLLALLVCAGLLALRPRRSR